MLERDRTDHRAVPCAGIGVAPRVVVAKEDFGEAAIDESADCADVAQLGGLQLERLRCASVRQALAGGHSVASILLAKEDERIDQLMPGGAAMLLAGVGTGTKLAVWGNLAPCAAVPAGGAAAAVTSSKARAMLPGIER